MSTSGQTYKAWFEKYRPRAIEEMVFPNQGMHEILSGFYNDERVHGNILCYGPPGFGKTSLSEVLIHRIVKDRNDLFVLGRKTEDVDNLKRWLQQRPVGSNQKIVKIEEMDRLSTQAQIVLKDGLMEKYQHNASFLATTNSPEKIDPALLTRFNTKLNFEELVPDSIQPRLEYILNAENIQYDQEVLKKFTEDFAKRGLRDLINNLEIASSGGTLDPKVLSSFIGTSGSETSVVQYIVYLTQLAESMTPEDLEIVIKKPEANPAFWEYYNYTLGILKKEMALNYHSIYKDLVNSPLDMAAKNIINDYWQDLELKRFKSTHTVSLIHDLVLNVRKQRPSC